MKRVKSRPTSEACKVHRETPARLIEPGRTASSIGSRNDCSRMMSNNSSSMGLPEVAFAVSAILGSTGHLDHLTGHHRLNFSCHHFVAVHAPPVILRREHFVAVLCKCFLGVDHCYIQCLAEPEHHLVNRAPK